jgi:hypothetical protein
MASAKALALEVLVRAVPCMKNELAISGLGRKEDVWAHSTQTSMCCSRCRSPASADLSSSSHSVGGDGLRTFLCHE